MRAGAASLPLDPPLGLPMLGFVRQILVATGMGWPLETGAEVLEQGGTRVVLCGVDIIGLQAPASERVIDRIAEVCGCDPARVLLGWNHTHLAPPGDERMALIGGAGADSDLMRETAQAIQDRMVEVWSQVTPEAERILVETGVRLAERLFPGCEPWPDEAGWTARAGAHEPLPREQLAHPDAAQV